MLIPQVLLTNKYPIVNTKNTPFYGQVSEKRGVYVLLLQVTDGAQHFAQFGHTLDQILLHGHIVNLHNFVSNVKKMDDF